MSGPVSPIGPVPPESPGRKRRLSDQDVFRIRRLYMFDGALKKDLAEEYGVNTYTISDAIHGKRAYKNV